MVPLGLRFCLYVEERVIFQHSELMLSHKLILANVGYNPDFLFAADLEKKPVRNIFRKFKYFFLWSALSYHSLKLLLRESFLQMGHP